MNDTNNKAMYKCELARLAGVSLRTLSKWLKDNEQELYKLGYKKNDHILTPKIVKFLKDKYVI